MADVQKPQSPKPEKTAPPKRFVFTDWAAI